MTSIVEKVSQMFILGFEGTELQENPNLINALKEGLGGVIFFTQNIEATEQIKKTIEDIKKTAKVSPFLAIDQEGGRVERTEKLFGGKKFLSAKLAAQKGEDFVKEQTKQISYLLKDLGFNLNFAPCVDVNTNPDNPIIGERAFSNDADEVIKFGKIVVETYLKKGIIPCLKHFPGHGDASVDSHLALPQIDLPLEEMEKIHIKPFKHINSPIIMVAHLHCSAFDKEVIPSSLSKNVINYLRDNLNYDGLIITDDMIMGGVNVSCHSEALAEESPSVEMFRFAQHDKNTLLAVQAIKAGENILLYRNSYDETVKIIKDLSELAENDEELYKKIENSYEKIIKFKQNMRQHGVFAK